MATIYRYYDEDKLLLLQIGRIDEPEGKGKRFLQRRPRRKVWYDGTHPQLEDQEFFYEVRDVRRVLYHLFALLRSETKRVFFCEGEKAADALNRWFSSQRKLGEYVATTTLGGAGKAHLTDFGDALKDKEVIIFPDNDVHGRKHGNDLRDLCSPTAKSVQLCELPDLPQKGDVADYLEAHAKSGERPTELLQLIGGTDWIPPTHPTTEAKATETPTTETVVPEGEGLLPEAANECLDEESGLSPDITASPDSSLATVRPSILEEEIEAPLNSLPPAPAAPLSLLPLCQRLRLS